MSLYLDYSQKNPLNLLTEAFWGIFIKCWKHESIFKHCTKFTYNLVVRHTLTESDEISSKKNSKKMQKMIKMARSSVKDQLQIKISKNSEPKCSFTHTFRAIYIASRACGQMPFSILRDLNGEIDRPVVNKLDGVWLVISLGILNYDLYRALDVHEMQNEVTSEIVVVGNTFISVILHILGLLAILLDMFYRFKLVDTLKKIIIFDKKVSLNIQNIFISFIASFNCQKYLLEHCRFNSWAFISITSKIIEVLGLSIQWHGCPLFFG